MNRTCPNDPPLTTSAKPAQHWLNHGNREPIEWICHRSRVNQHSLCVYVVLAGMFIAEFSYIRLCVQRIWFLLRPKFSDAANSQLLRSWLPLSHFFSLPFSFSVFYPRHSIQSAWQKQKRPPEHKKKIRRFRRVVISRRSIGSTASTSIRMATLGESSTKQCEIPAKMLILCLQLDFDFESNDNRVNCNFRSLNQRSPYCCFTFDQRI